MSQVVEAHPGKRPIVIGASGRTYTGNDFGQVTEMELKLVQVAGKLSLRVKEGEQSVCGRGRHAVRLQI